MAGEGMILCGALVVIPMAVILDLVFADPPNWPHPVRWMGSAIEWLEPPIRKWIPNPQLGGSVFALALIAVTFATAFGLVQLAYRYSPLAGIGIEIVMIYTAISIQSLRKAAMAVYAALGAGSLSAARNRLSRIVGRDTRDLDKLDVIRATVETVAENLVDGVISPLFYGAIGGAPLAMAYKMVNTLDSMVGYKNQAYRHFGKAAARIDDAANFIPARISILLIAISAQAILRNGLTAFNTALREGHLHTSPNAGRPEAAFAGALKIRLGGPSHYHGELVTKPYIGHGFGDAELGDISKACRLMVFTSLLWAAMLTGVNALWEWPW